MSERSVSRRRQEKQWYTVHAPEQFDRAPIGETPADEPENVLERTVQTTLADITGNPNQNNVKLTFKINDVGSDAAYTEFIQHELTRDYLRSLIRRGSTKVAVILTVRTADNFRVRVQPVAFTTKRANHGQQHAIRQTMTDLVESAARDRSYRDFTDSIVQGRLSSAIYNEAKTIYPLRRVEIQKARLLTRPEDLPPEGKPTTEAEAETAADDTEPDGDPTEQEPAPAATAEEPED